MKWLLITHNYVYTISLLNKTFINYTLHTRLIKQLDQILSNPTNRLNSTIGLV